MTFTLKWEALHPHNSSLDSSKESILYFLFCFSWIFSFLGAAAIWRFSKNSSNPIKIYFLCRIIACSRSFIVNFSNASFYKGKENIRFISNSCLFSKSLFTYNYFFHVFIYMLFLCFSVVGNELQKYFVAFKMSRMTRNRKLSLSFLWLNYWYLGKKLVIIQNQNIHYSKLSFQRYGYFYNRSLRI